MLLAVRAFIAAHRGDADACRRLATEAIAAGERRSLKIAVITGRSAIALLELSLGEHARAAAELADLERELTAAGVGQSRAACASSPTTPRRSSGWESSTGRASVIDRYEAHAVRLDRPAARASALRCHGLIDAAAGDRDGALRAFAAALEQHDRLVLPIDRARTLLAHGALLRRAKQKRQRAQHSTRRSQASRRPARSCSPTPPSASSRGSAAAPHHPTADTERRLAELPPRRPLAAHPGALGCAA